MQVESGVSADDLAAISRWAADQTRRAALPAGWAVRMPMDPLGVRGGVAIFGQDAQSSTLALPSHAPIVHRRALLRAEYDRAGGRITRVIVTIGGWAEE